MLQCPRMVQNKVVAFLGMRRLSRRLDGLFTKQRLISPLLKQGGYKALILTSDRTRLYNRTHELQSNRHVLYARKYQGVFCPKFRRTGLVGGVDKRLKEIIDPVAKELGGEILGLEVMPDPVHILCEVDPQYGIHKGAFHFTDHLLFLLFDTSPSTQVTTCEAILSAFLYSAAETLSDTPGYRVSTA